MGQSIVKNETKAHVEINLRGEEAQSLSLWADKFCNGDSAEAARQLIGLGLEAARYPVDCNCGQHEK